MSRRRRSRKLRKWLWRIGGMAALIGIGAGVYFSVDWDRFRKLDAVVEPAAPEPPEVDFADVDPAVVRLVNDTRAAVRNRPASADSWGKLGMVFLAHQFEDAAAECFTRVTEMQPDNARWSYYHALSVTRLRPDEALPLFRRAAELSPPGSQVPRLRYYELFHELDRGGEIEAELKKFLAENPDDARAHVLLARMYLRAGRLDDCLQELVFVGGNRAGQRPMHEIRAEVFSRQGKKEQADQARRLAAASPAIRWPDPFFDEINQLKVGLKVHLNRAERLYNEGKPLDSLLTAEQAVKEYPQSEWAWILVGRAQIRLRRLDEAEQSITKALAISPRSADALFRMAVIKFLRGNPVESTDWFLKVIEQKPDHPVALYNLGMCAEKTNQPARAAEYYRQALNCLYDYAEAHVALTNLLEKQGDRDAARRHLEEAVRLRPNDAGLRTRLERWPEASTSSK